MPPRGHSTHHLPVDYLSVYLADREGRSLTVQCRDRDAFGKFCGCWFTVTVKQVGLSYKSEDKRMTHRLTETGEYVPL